MITFGTQIATVITIVLIGTILTGYVPILKRNGWIGKTSFETGLKKQFCHKPAGDNITKTMRSHS